MEDRTMECPYCGSEVRILPKTKCRRCSLAIEIYEKEISLEEARTVIIICKKD